MAVEFHNTDFSCASGSVVPSGPSYQDAAYQTCGSSGSRPGTTVVGGDEYLAAHYGFHYSNVWRNFGILCLFTVVYIAATCWMSEILDWESTSVGPIQYKKGGRGTSRSVRKSRDEESSPVQIDEKLPASPESSSERPTQALDGTSSTFTWDNLELVVQIGKEARKLLDGVSGYCKPGTVTALVGASGAGKSTCAIINSPPTNVMRCLLTVT